MRLLHAVLLGFLAVAPLAAAAPPTATFVLEPERVAPGEEAVANASASADPDGRGIVRYEWSVAEGPYVEGNRTQTFRFNATAYVPIRLRVWDADNESAVSGTQYLTVGSPAERPLFDASAIPRFLPLLARAAVITVQLAVGAILLGLPIAVLVAFARQSAFLPLRALATVYVEVLRGSPLLLQIVAWFLIPPVLTQGLHARFEWFPVVSLDAFEAGLVALMINTSAYQSEIIRAGIQAIPTGQTEAALSLGMTKRQAMRLVVLPQAFRLIAPPMTNEFIVLLKDTSLVSTIGLFPPELFGTANVLIGQTFLVVEILVAVAIIYIAITWTLSQLLRWLERRYRIPGLGVQA